MLDSFRPARIQHVGECAYHITLGCGTNGGEGDALVPLCGGSQPHDLDMLDMETLLAFQLITLERLDPGVSVPRVMLQGYVLLKSVGVLRACRGILVTMA